MKEADIRSPELLDRYLSLSAQDAEVFFRDRSSFADILCPGCGCAGSPEAFTKNDFRYVECEACGSLFVSPRPPREALDRYYSASPSASFWADTFFPATAENRRHNIFVPRVEQVQLLLAERGVAVSNIIDVGAGYGIFLEEFVKRHPGIRAAAVEPGRKLADVCRSKGFETLEQPVEEATSWSGRADLVTCFEVLEHVHSLPEFVASLGRLARHGGCVLATGLGVDGFDIQVLWNRSKSVSPPHHLNFLSVSGFTQLFERLGFTDVEVMTPGRLDVDIVANATAVGEAAPGVSRFMRLLQKRGETAQAELQQFLVRHRLSSHTWILARKA